MRYLKYLLILIITLSINACCSQKNTNTEVKEETIEVVSQPQKIMIQQGYHQAIIIYDKEKSTPCNYLIRLGDNLLLEPMRTIKVDFQKDKQKIWVKYHPQRRMSRCGNAQPVEIIGIDFRE
jgi:thioredoxin-related protein